MADDQMPNGNEAPHWRFSIFILVIGAFMAILDTTIVNVAIPTLMSTFGVSTDQIQWVVTIYMLTLGVVVPASGWLGEKLGYKALYMISLAIFVLGSSLSGLSWNLNAMIAFRVLQALGGGMIMPVTMTMLFRIVPRKEIGMAMGIWGIAAMAAPAIGPTLGGYFVEYLNWRFIFYVNVPVGALGLALAYGQLPHIESPTPGAFDWPGFGASAISLFSLLLGLSEGQSWGWHSEAVVLMLAISVLAAAFFVYFELTTERPLLDIRLFVRYPQYLLTSLILVVVVVALFSGTFYIPLFLQTVRGLGAFDTGLILTPAAVVTGLLMPVSGKIFDRFDRWGPVMTVLPGLLVLGYTTYLFHNLSTSTPTSTIVLWMMLRGVGMGLSMMPVSTAGMSWIPQSKVGQASAINNIIQRVAGSFGIAVLTVVAQAAAASRYNVLASQVTPLRGPITFLSQQMTALFVTTGLPAQPASATGLGVLSGYLQALSFADSLDYIFVVTALITLLGAVLAVWVRKAHNEHMEAVMLE